MSEQTYLLFVRRVEVKAPTTWTDKMGEMMYNEVGRIYHDHMEQLRKELNELNPELTVRVGA